MKIAVVSAFYSEGMGYTENCLPKALAALGHEVHVLTSTLNVYGNDSDYDATYRTFLGPADQGTGEFSCDGYSVHRLPSRRIGQYVMLRRLAAKLRELGPEIVHSIAMESLQTFKLAALRSVFGFKLFTETHQHLSVVRPYMKSPGRPRLRRAAYWMTRTLPTYLSSFAVERCYAISPDCLYVARKFYGVPEKKLKIQSLGTDTVRFHPAESPAEFALRSEIRGRLGFGEHAIVCVYTGRFSADKNPLVLAKAVEILAGRDPRFQSLFIGEGPQREAIAACAHATIVPFMKHTQLADFYRAVDIAVWPRQESMSMLDAAASGLPLVVSAAMGDSDRVAGNGRVYLEDSVEDMVSTLSTLASADDRRELGITGRDKMIRSFSWDGVARAIVSDYQFAMGWSA